MSACMGSENPATSSYLQETIQGIIFRTATTCSGSYAYLPLPPDLPTVFDSNVLNTAIAETLTTAPHFPDIAILDSVPSNILYHPHNSPSLLHVLNLLTGDHFPISFPHPHTIVNAAIITHQSCHFKVLAVCIKDNYSPKALAFYVYSSESKDWSEVKLDAGKITGDQLLRSRRKPIHAGEDVLYLDLTDRFVICFNYENQLLHLPKLVAPWEKESSKLDESTRYGDCMGWLHCAKINPVRNRVEVYVWTMEPPKGAWRLVLAGDDGSWRPWRGKVVALHPFKESMVFVRMDGSDAIVLIDIRRQLQWDVVPGRGMRCGPACYTVGGMAEAFEAAMVGGAAAEAAGRRSNCGILHPHENREGPEGEIFVISLSTQHPELR